MAFPGLARSPSKDSNVHGHGHPYAIKTTSTAILSRSNSISGRSSTPLDQVYTSSTAKPLGRSQSRGHGRANSLSNIAPPALPLPTKRRDSLGSAGGDSVPPTPQPEAIAQLPDNPKHWTPSQLSIYLSSALRFRGGGAIPARVAKDIAAFTLKERLTGKAFLRLSEENLVAMGINQLWRDSLLAASRTLRKKVLKGRIWGFGSQPDTENEDTPIKSQRRIPSTVDEEPAPSPPTSGYRGGRVRNMVESLERSTGSDGSDEANADQSLNEARMASELKAAGLWISDEEEEDLAGDISSSSASDNESIEEYHSRNSSLGSQPPAYSRNALVGEPNEPTVAELLAQDSSFDSPAKKHGPRNATFEEAPSWGAMMWEKDADIIGGTAKKVVPADAPRPIKPGVTHGAPQPNILNMFGEQQTLSTELEPEPQTEAHEQAVSLLEAFKTRLEAMETRLKELELRDEEREKELQILREREKQRVDEEKNSQLTKSTIDLSLDPDPYATVVDEDSDPVDIPWPRPLRPVLKSTGTAIITPQITGDGKKSVTIQDPESTKENRHETDDPPLDEVSPSELSELPAYVLLVTMGVAAVVARVLFRRIGGRRP